jgi:hypothetical protein
MKRLLLITELRVSFSNGAIETSITGLIYVLIDPNAPAVAPDADADAEDEAEEPTATPTPTDAPTSTPTPTNTAPVTP